MKKLVMNDSLRWGIVQLRDRRQITLPISVVDEDNIPEGAMLCVIAIGNDNNAWLLKLLEPDREAVQMVNFLRAAISDPAEAVLAAKAREEK